MQTINFCYRKLEVVFEAFLNDGRLVALCRGSNDKAGELPGYKWMAFSSDEGESWTKPVTFRCDDVSKYNQQLDQSEPHTFPCPFYSFWPGRQELYVVHMRANTQTCFAGVVDRRVVKTQVLDCHTGHRMFDIETTKR